MNCESLSVTRTNYPQPHNFYPFIRLGCQFCTSQKGDVTLNNLDEDGNYVYMACENSICKTMRQEASSNFIKKKKKEANWNIIESFIGKQIKVLRTSDAIDDTWYVRPDYKMKIDNYGNIYVFASTQQDNDYGKYISVSDFFLLNVPNKEKKQEQINEIPTMFKKFFAVIMFFFVYIKSFVLFNR